MHVHLYVISRLLLLASSMFGDKPLDGVFEAMVCVDLLLETVLRLNLSLFVSSSWLDLSSKKVYMHTMCNIYREDFTQ